MPARGLAVYGDELILPQDYNVTAGNTRLHLSKNRQQPATPSRTITGSNTLLAGLVGACIQRRASAMTSGAVRVQHPAITATSRRSARSAVRRPGSPSGRGVDDW